MGSQINVFHLCSTRRLDVSRKTLDPNAVSGASMQQHQKMHLLWKVELHGAVHCSAAIPITHQTGLARLCNLINYVAVTHRHKSAAARIEVASISYVAVADDDGEDEDEAGWKPRTASDTTDPGVYRLSNFGCYFAGKLDYPYRGPSADGGIFVN